MTKPHKEVLHIGIDGEFITNLARTWFWEESRPLQIVKDFLYCCFDDIPDEDTKLKIMTDILEGRKKFVGVNNFELIDDNEHIRPLTNYLIMQERKTGILQIQQDMEFSFRKYVDKWATVKSMHPDALANNGMPLTWQECKQYFSTTRTDFAYHTEKIMIGDTPIIETPTAGGLWLYDNPDMVFDACKGDIAMIGSSDFWHQIYLMTKDNPDFDERNRRYLVHKNRISTSQSINNLPSSLEKEQTEKKLTEEPLYLTPEWFQYQYNLTNDLCYVMKPDDITNWEGLIAPNGDFYSVTFGSHNAKAYYLLHRHPEKCHISLDELEEKHITLDNALDLLIEHGWCATRSVMYDQYVLPSFPKRPTKRQIETIIKAIQKHQATININELLEYL